MSFKSLDLTLLYVEDDDNARMRLTEVFKHKVENLYVAKDAIEALELFKKHYIHFIISDFQMPNMNGNELCSAIKKINPSVCFVLLTAYNDSNLLINAIDVGVDKFLQKPVNAKKLFNVIDAIYEKIMNKFQLEKSRVCLQEAEKIALLSYWDVNLKTGNISFSQEAKELFNLSGEIDNDISYKDFLAIVKEEDKIKFLEIFERRVFEEEKIDEIVVIKDSNNKDIYIHLIAKRRESSSCGNKHMIGIFQDVSHYESQKIRLIKESQLDPMLRIANKKLIISSLEDLIKSSKRYGHAIGVIFFDIDNFKFVNDRYGHLIADNLLVELSNIIKNNLRQSDIFGRWGGDEFVVITGYSSPDATVKLAKKISTKISECKWECKVNITVSMGLSFYKAGDDVNVLLNRADLKMLEAKKDGKNRYNY